MLSVGSYYENRGRVFEAFRGISLHNFLCMMDGDILTRFRDQDRSKPFSSMKLSGAPSSTFVCRLLLVDESLSTGHNPVRQKYSVPLTMCRVWIETSVKDAGWTRARQEG